MEIYNYDRTTGAYLGSGVADPDPKSPARHIIPAYATTVAPPAEDENSIRVFRDGGWGYVPREEPEQEPSTDPIPVDLVAYAADRRWFIEMSGFRFNGWPVKTDALSQAKITSERLAVASGVRLDTDSWKFGDGVFRVVTNEQFVALSNAARDHVRLCFFREGEIQVAIAAGTVTTKAEIDEALAYLDKPWPFEDGADPGTGVPVQDDPSEDAPAPEDPDTPTEPDHEPVETP